MFKLMMRISIILAIALSLIACVNKQSPRIMSELAFGKRLFKEGYYKRSMNILLPLACEGVADAQYAIGYLYYYGYGVCQDTDVGHFWIKRAALANYLPAINALAIIENPCIAPTQKKPPVWTKNPNLI